MWEYLGPLVIGYLIGSVPFGYMIAVAHGVKISKVGSGSNGGTNIMRTLGLKWGLFVTTLDMAKGAAAVLIAILAFGHGWMFASAVLFMTALGHAYPLFLALGFRGGGKSVSTIVGGMALIASWQAVIIVLAIWFIAAIIQMKAKKFIMSRTNLLVLGLGIPIGLGVSQSHQWWLVVIPPWGFLIGVAFVAFIYFKHSGNIKRLLRGEEKPLKIK